MMQNENLESLAITLSLDVVNDECVKTNTNLFSTLRNTCFIMRGIPLQLDRETFIKNQLNNLKNQMLFDILEELGVLTPDIYLKELCRDIIKFKGDKKPVYTINFYLTLKIFDSMEESKKKHGKPIIEPQKFSISMTIYDAILNLYDIEPIVKEKLNELFKGFINKCDIKTISNLFYSNLELELMDNIDKE